MTLGEAIDAMIEGEMVTHPFLSSPIWLSKSGVLAANLCDVPSWEYLFAQSKFKEGWSICEKPKPKPKKQVWQWVVCRRQSEPNFSITERLYTEADAKSVYHDYWYRAKHGPPIEVPE